MNATDKTEALRLLDEMGDAALAMNPPPPLWARHSDARKALRSLLSAQEAEPVADHNVEAVRTKLLDRSRRGIAKYGTTTERDDLSLQDWLVHMQEELLDAAVYIQAAMRKGQEPSAEHWRQAFAERGGTDWEYEFIEQRARELTRKGWGMGDPIRVQLSRRKGWRMPPRTMNVARPSKFGNPFIVTDKHLPGTVIDELRGTIAVATAKDAVAAYASWLGTTLDGGAVRDKARRRLRGLNLACWCKLGEPCHADVLLEIANSQEPPK